MRERNEGEDDLEGRLAEPKSSLPLGTRICLLLATGFGTGLSPIAPGTVGSLLGPPLVWGVQYFLPIWAYWPVAGLVLVGGTIVCEIAARHLRLDDPPAVVIDEIAAFFIVYALVPVTPATAVIGFALFRLFDISKVWPVSLMEDFHGGVGIMLDDLVAGFYAGLVLTGIFVATGTVGPITDDRTSTLPHRSAVATLQFEDYEFGGEDQKHAREDY
ncbi:phosphatidylglycerophosphatase A family protein [Stratiformator vulcanicus]|uniref:phosphatidylglycerophosphatase A family protein n=1 Tax=Stratiformator vulcanicus TaxID=2527980 RepID=UPI0028778C86|nr:phosphatidylglycerophosphatase A [Stratiformator vulcanicus]